jgi:hypothetical protein
LRNHIILITMLTLWVSLASCSMGGDSVGLDMLGSSVNNTTITSPEGMPIEVDIIGSTATNIQIGYPIDEVNETCSIDCDGCNPCGGKKCYITPWDDFRRPLCYPWSSYIPSRYNRLFINENRVHYSTGYDAITLGGR